MEPVLKYIYLCDCINQKTKMKQKCYLHQSQNNNIKNGNKISSYGYWYLACRNFGWKDKGVPTGMCCKYFQWVEHDMVLDTEQILYPIMLPTISLNTSADNNSIIEIDGSEDNLDA